MITDGLGKLAYHAYIDARGGRNPDGSPPPQWSALGNDIRDAWDEMAEEVAKKVSADATNTSEGRFRF